MQIYEIKNAIDNYNEGDEISFYTYMDGRVKGILIDCDDDCIKIRSEEDGEIITLSYSEITNI